MATNKRFGKRIPEWARREDTAGTRIDSGPYIGYVKNNFDPYRAGRLQVWIPELSGDETRPENWRTVSYASPYGGTTYRDHNDTGSNNEFSQVTHSYGMWGVPPDIGCQVICTFIAGDANRGYWFGCINTDVSHYMVPGLAAGPVDTQFASAELKAEYSSDSNWPVVEFNEAVPGSTDSGFMTNTKPPHDEQVNILIGQGLDKDKARGAISSSSQRESPSQVWGISTPGRPINDPADNPEFQAKMLAGTLSPAESAIKGRKGGHSFVMDDGDQTGASQLIRLRTAGGHQIMMNDSEDIIYIANNAGTTWLEFTSGGHISMYSQAGINLRTEGEFNIHADGDLNLNSKNNINLNAAAIKQQATTATVKASSINMQASSIGLLSTGVLGLQGASGGFKTSGDLVLKGDKLYFNTMAPADVPTVAGLTTYSHADTSAESSGLWVSTPDVFESVVTVAPSHEPWPRKATSTGTSLNAAVAPVAKQSSTGTSTNPKDPGPVAAKGLQVAPMAPVSEMTSKTAPAHVSAGTRLSSIQVKALMVQIGYAESKSTSTTRYGKYQINNTLLIGYSYMTAAGAWTGQDGINNSTDWGNAVGVQEKVMQQIINDFYDQLSNQNAIAIADDIPTVAGMISVAYYFRDDAAPIASAKTWRLQNTPPSGTTPYNWGRYAIDVLALPAAPVLVSEPSASGIGPTDVINFTNGSGDLTHYNLLGATMKTNMEKMAAEFKAKTGRKITLSSAVRTMAEQTAIYNGWLAAGGTSSNRTVNVPGYGHISMPAKPSSNSPHVRGVAFDIGRADVQALIQMGLLDKYSFNFPFPANDPVHIQNKG